MISCDDCKFCVLVESYNKGDEFVECLADSHPIDSFLYELGENVHIAFAAKCKNFEAGQLIHLDRKRFLTENGGCISSYSDDEEAKQLLIEKFREW